METQTEILVVGTNVSILETILRLLNNNPSWNATGVSGPEEAFQKCRETTYRVLLIGAGLTAEQETQLGNGVKEIHPEILLIPHYGGGSGLLFAEIYLALGTKNQAQ